MIDNELIRGMGEKEVELEHLKTVIVGLNEKLKMREDIDRDLQNAKGGLEEHEVARKNLHS